MIKKKHLKKPPKKHYLNQTQEVQLYGKKTTDITYLIKNKEDC